MPAKNSLKIYVEGGYYHVYNRGVAKMNIFLDEQDYRVFLDYLKTYLLPKDKEALMQKISDQTASPKEKDNALRLLGLNNFHQRIELLCYCLMPNHLHFLFKQSGVKDMEIFMKSLMTRYTQYFNRRYDRVGPIWQGRYKAILLETDEQLLHLTRYIHRNPDSLKRTVPTGTVLFEQPSSYPNYLGEISQLWVKPEFVLQNFEMSGFSSYRAFVESDDSDVEAQSAVTLEKVTLD